MQEIDVDYSKQYIDYYMTVSIYTSKTFITIENNIIERSFGTSTHNHQDGNTSK